MFNLITFLIMCVGGLNWLCIGLFQFDVIAGIFGSQAHFVSRFLYVIIGLATIYSLIALPIKKGKVYEPKNKNKSQNTVPETLTKEPTEEKTAPKKTFSGTKGKNRPIIATIKSNKKVKPKK